MTARPAKWVLAALVTASTLTLGGCWHPRAMSGLTAQSAEQETNELVASAIAAIDSAVIARIDRMSDESVSSYGSDVDRRGQYRQWDRLDYVWLTPGTKQLDLLSTLVQSYRDNGWIVTWDQPASDKGGRTVQLRKENRPAGETYGLSFTTGANDQFPVVINVGSTSPCFFDPTR